MAKSSKDALGVNATAEAFKTTECDNGAHCLFAEVAKVFDGVGAAFLFAFGPDIDFGSWEALSFASSTSSPEAKGPGLRHFPAIFLEEVNGLLEFAVAEGRGGNLLGVGMLLAFVEVANGFADSNGRSGDVGFCKG